MIPSVMLSYPIQNNAGNSQMGFQKPDLGRARAEIQRCLGEIHSPYNDGFTSSYCKQDLYVLKCWLEDEYRRLPTFTGEEQWEQARMIDLLKQK